MDYLSLFRVILFLYTCLHFFTRSIGAWKTKQITLPPGPRPFPIIGNILELGKKPPHQALANLSKTYGPIMTLKLGSITTIVVSSPSIAKEALQKHDQALSSRTIPDAARVLDHHNYSIAWLPATTPWRNLRKICVTQLFSTQRMDATKAIRHKKVKELLDYVQENCSNGCAVDIGQAVFTTILNLISNTFFSIDLAQYQSDQSQNFKENVCLLMEELGSPNLADYFPALRFVDPQGLRNRTTTYSERIFRIFDGIIDERIKARAMGSSMMSKESNDLLDSLLNLVEENNSEFSISHVKHLLLDLFAAGIDTSSTTVEWAMTELLKNPTKLTKSQTELREALGKDGTVEEFEISKFPYVQAIVKETLRLHPPGPFLVPHKAEIDIELCGFKVPKNSQVLVNVWAMGRDSSIWRNPTSFMPERFLECEIDVKGRDFELIPFGAGRRICPGMPLAHRMVHLLLASLVYTFDWKLVDGLKPENMDMTEKFGLSLHKVMPLSAIPMKV